MNKSNKLDRKIKETALKIANISASLEHRDGTWWGFDSSLGDLPFQIQKELSKLVDWFDTNYGG